MLIGGTKNYYAIFAITPCLCADHHMHFWARLIIFLLFQTRAALGDSSLLIGFQSILQVLCFFQPGVI